MGNLQNYQSQCRKILCLAAKRRETINYAQFVNYSAVPTEFTCEGETRKGDGPPERDTGRLRVDDYRWWVGLWSDSHGSANFQSKNIAYFYASKLNRSGAGNFSFYMGLDPDKSFVLRRATGELGIQESVGGKLFYTFVGECKEAR